MLLLSFCQPYLLFNLRREANDKWLIHLSSWFSRFALDIDLDAPKVTVPMRTVSSSNCDMHFLLDFGHFTLHTMVCFFS